VSSRIIEAPSGNSVRIGGSTITYERESMSATANVEVIETYGEAISRGELAALPGALYKRTVEDDFMETVRRSGA